MASSLASCSGEVGSICGSVIYHNHQGRTGAVLRRPQVGASALSLREFVHDNGNDACHHKDGEGHRRCMSHDMRRAPVAKMKNGMRYTECLSLLAGTSIMGLIGHKGNPCRQEIMTILYPNRCSPTKSLRRRAHSPAAKPAAPQPKNQNPHKRDSKALALENTVEESGYLRHPAHGGRCPMPLFTNTGRGGFGFSGFGGSLSLTGVLGPGTSSDSSWKREMTTIHAWREHPCASSSGSQRKLRPDHDCF